jgi:hypothetical protein
MERMASLQDRIRSAARDEVARALGKTPVETAAPGPADLQQQITDLHEHIHLAVTTIRRMEARVEELEKTAAELTADAPEQKAPAPSQEAPAERRTTRKRADA